MLKLQGRLESQWVTRFLESFFLGAGLTHQGVNTLSFLVTSEMEEVHVGSFRERKCFVVTIVFTANKKLSCCALWCLEQCTLFCLKNLLVCNIYNASKTDTLPVFEVVLSFLFQSI